MGGRGGYSGKYAGRYSLANDARNTNERLPAARKGLEYYIAKEKDSIAHSADNYLSGPKERLAYHKSKLKTLNEQLSELKREYKRRGMKW
ncbi:MAG: hypothetical protein LUE89_04595 [Clostridiales bacterium]|nr:hypothetical protein [Clostridiales bacterium]